MIPANMFTPLSQKYGNHIGRIGLSVSKAVLTNSWKRPTWHPYVRTDFIRLGPVATNRENGLTGEQLVVGADSRSVSTRPSQVFSVFTEGCHVGYSREFVGTVYCTYGQSNTTIYCYHRGRQFYHYKRRQFHSLQPRARLISFTVKSSRDNGI